MTSKKLWTKELCMEFCKPYKTRKEVMVANFPIYQACCRNKWFDEMPWVIKQKQDKNWDWTVIKRYIDQGELQRENPNLYNRLYLWAKRNSKPLSYYYEQVGWITHKNIWTKEKCFEFCENYRTRGEIAKHSSRVYELCKLNGWFEEMPWLRKKGRG